MVNEVLYKNFFKNIGIFVKLTVVSVNALQELELIYKCCDCDDINI